MSSFFHVERVFVVLGAACAGCAAGMMVGGGGGGQPLSTPAPGGGAATPVLSPLLQKAVSKGLPSDERVRFFDGFVASLNYERRVPNWVLEYIPHPSSAGAVPKEGEGGEAGADKNGGGGDGEAAAVRRDGMKFLADADIPEMFRVLPDDYVGGKEQNARGLSRGHLAAAQFHKKSSKEMEQTFNMNANIVPQDMTMNAVDWLRLENLTKKLLKRYEGGLWVVTGPVFHPRYIHGEPRSWGWTESRMSSAITPADVSGSAETDAKKTRKVVCYELVGKHDVAVPTHLFKVMLGERADGSHEVAAFLMPNEPITTERSLLTYQVPVSEIEQKTGLQIFRDTLLTNTVSTMLPWNGSSGAEKTQGLDVLPNICRRTSCEVRTAPLFQVYRSVAQLRAARSLPELQKVFTTLSKEQQQQQGDDKPPKLDTVVLKEYEERRRELMGEALSGRG